jgi:Protein of unknown function (DUF2802)
MDALVVTWRELAIVVVAVVLIYVVELLLLLRWSGARRRGLSASSEGVPVDELQREIGDLRKHVTRLEGEVDKLQATPAAFVSPYNLAIQMARQGAAAGEVARGCGISRGEAELIVALYRKLRI